MLEEEIMLGAKVPSQWREKYEALARDAGISLTEVVRDALAQYIGAHNKSSALVSPLELLQSQITTLREQVEELMLYKNQMRELSIRLSVLEQGITKIQTELVPSGTISVSDAVLIDPDEEYFEDEPDEILTDFLPNAKGL